MSPVWIARSQMNVPPRLSRRSTGSPAYALDRLRHQLAEDHLLGEVLGADDDAFRPGPGGHGAMPIAATTTIAAAAAREQRPAAPAPRQRALGEQQAAVHDHRQRRDRNRAGEDHGRIDHRQPAVDVLAETARADRGRDRHGADADDRRRRGCPQ